MNPSNLNLTYDVRLWAITVYKGKRQTTYTVRWLTAGETHQETYTGKKLAEGFLSKLTTAAREGVPFDIASGLPAPMARELNRRSVFEHLAAFVDSKWAHASPRHRKNIAEALSQVMFALLPSKGLSKAEAAKVRSVLRTWAFNKAARSHLPVGDAVPADSEAARLRWIAAQSPDLSELRDAETVRRVLDALALKLDGKAAAASTVSRKRSAFYSAMEYAVELDIFEVNPIEKVTWTGPESTEVVDRRVVANPSQMRLLLKAMETIHPTLVAFFACLYFAALRPSEAKHLSLHDCHLPEQGWGYLLLTGSTQHAGGDWTDDGEASEDRSLKHRSDKATRLVPACPELVRFLLWHVEKFGTGPKGRLFVSRTGKAGVPLPPPYSNPVSSNTYSRAWQKARAMVLTEAQVESPLAGRPYDCRHAALSLWLNAGVPATQVAEWAGHSVKVLLQVYAACIDGQDEIAKRRIEAALDDPPASQAA